MKRNLLFAVLLATGFSAIAQEQLDHPAPRALVATTKGDDSYLLFSSDRYKADKKYVVFKVWNESAPLSDNEQSALQELKTLLAKKGIDVVSTAWKTEADLQAVFKPYGIEVEANDGKHIRLKTGNSSLHTTSAKALYVIEESKPVSLCSGSNCEERLKYFFQLKALN